MSPAYFFSLKYSKLRLTGSGHSSPYWCSVPNIRKLACVVPEKNETEIFCDADARRQKWSLYVASAKAGRRHNKCIHNDYTITLTERKKNYLLFENKMVHIHKTRIHYTQGWFVSGLVKTGLLLLKNKVFKVLSMYHPYFGIKARVILSWGLQIRRPNFLELMKITIMIFFTRIVYFSGKFMSDHKGFSIYNESGSKHVFKTLWLKHFNY